jgi:uncharacterized membrane protein
MSWYPSIPGWDGLHPAIVHFPVALLLAAPLIIFASLFARGNWRSWAGASLLVMGVGALATWWAVGTGHAAGQLVDKSVELERAVLGHEALGVLTRNLFTGLAVVYAVLVMLPTWIKRPMPAAFRITLHAVFLAGYVAATGVLAQTANAGGHLVHESGVKAMLEQQAAIPPAAPTPVAPAPGQPVRR